MNVHIATINALNMSPRDFAAAKDRDLTIREMAAQLVAGASGGLDLSADPDVVQYLFDCPARYRWPEIKSHADAAISFARETIAAAAEGLR